MISILTGQDNVRLLARHTSHEISEEWKKQLLIDVGDDFRNLGPIEYWECPITNIRWYTPEEAAGGCELYAQLENFDWYYMSDKWEFSAALSLLPFPASILEVGVGEGHFLQSAREHKHTVQGVELNPKGAKRARRLGFQVYELSLDDLSKQTNERFDAICSFQVLEHVPNPYKFLEGMISLLKPGGKMILSVPNSAVMRKIDPQNIGLLNQPPHHMSHWDESVFRALEELLPLKVKSVHREPLASYHVAGVVTGYLRNIFFQQGITIPRFLVNRYTTLPIQWLMLLGVRNFFPGHTLLVELEYQPN